MRLMFTNHVHLHNNVKHFVIHFMYEKHIINNYLFLFDPLDPNLNPFVFLSVIT